MFAPWWKFSTDAMMLALEAQGVIAMRLTSIALGRGTHAENTRMVSEKAAAFAEAEDDLGTDYPMLQYSTGDHSAAIGRLCWYFFPPQRPRKTGEEVPVPA